MRMWDLRELMWWMIDWSFSSQCDFGVYCLGSLEPEYSCHDRDWIMELPMEADILTFTGILTPENASVASCCSGSAGASVVAHNVALPLIKIAFSTLDCSIVPTCGAWGSATAAKHGPLKQSSAGIQHSRDDEPLGVLMQMRNVRVNGFFFFSSLGVLPGVLVDTLSLCSGNFCVECVLIVLHKFYIELYKKYNWLDPGPSMRFDEIILLFCNKCR